jgi:TolB-like protein
MEWAITERGKKADQYPKHFANSWSQIPENSKWRYRLEGHIQSEAARRRVRLIKHHQGKGFVAKLWK